MKLELEQAFERFRELFEHQAFELCRMEGSSDFYIPYMMNDALECYLILKNGRITGQYFKDYKEIEGELAREETAGGVILRQLLEDGSRSICTLWFEEIFEERACYQYHAIGHFWVKGQEQWRQLVYMLGTLYDKYAYMGEAVTSPEEKELLRLMEFPPLRAFSPVSESLEEVYPGTFEGVGQMKKMALEAGDLWYGRLISLYEKWPFKWLESCLRGMLLRPERRALYLLLWKKICAASMAYPARSYSPGQEKAMAEMRKEADLYLKKQGFSGEYPEYFRENIWVSAVEEHPFTILEAESFSFQLRFMVSVLPKGKEAWRSCGFFKGGMGEILGLDELMEELEAGKM